MRLSRNFSILSFKHRFAAEMRTITGKVTCNEIQEIPAGAVAQISVQDCSRMDVKSKTLGKQVIKDPKKFPIEFKVEFNEEPVLKMIRGRYAIQVLINLGDRLIFRTDTHHSIVDHATDTINDHMDVPVIKVVRFDEDYRPIQD